MSRWSAWTPPAEPDVSVLPPLLRRRCSRMTRAMLHVAFGVATIDELATLPAVFGSRHGELTATVGLLETLARGQALTAAGFSHSVHNAPVGLFSIATRNRGITSAVAAGVITDWGPNLSPEALGFPVTAFLTLEIRQGAGHDTVAAHLAAIPEVLEAYTITGAGDMWARVVARSNADLQRVIDQVLADPGINRSTTVIALADQIRHRVLPLARAAVDN